MFKKKVLPLSEVISDIMRQSSLDTPLKQRRIIGYWDEVAGPVACRYTTEKYIKNQTLFVKILNPALKADLMMRRTELQNLLNAKVGSFIISEIKFI